MNLAQFKKLKQGALIHGYGGLFEVQVVWPEEKKIKLVDVQRSIVLDTTYQAMKHLKVKK